MSAEHLRRALNPGGRRDHRLGRRPAPMTPAAAGTTSCAFVRDRLPDPVGYYVHSGLRLIGRGRWRSTLCPFHDDSRPSLRVNVETGAFRCMACGAKGGDVLDFHRAKHGLSFQQAARDLGAWVAA